MGLKQDKKLKLLFLNDTMRIGDLLMMLRSVELTRLQYPAAKIFVQCNYPELIQCHPAIDEVMSMEVQLIEPDITINGNIYCKDYERRHQFNISKSRHQLFCEYTSMVLQDNNLQWDGRSQSLWVSRALFEWAYNIVGNARENKIPIGVFGKSREWWKNWPHIRRLLNYLLADKRFAIFYFSAEEASPVMGIHSFTGYSLNRVVALITCMHLVISNDSGGLHLAGSLGVPTIGIFGPSNPLVLAAIYSDVSWPQPIKCPLHPCWYNPCQQIHCLRQIKPSTIYKMVCGKISIFRPVIPRISNKDNIVPKLHCDFRISRSHNGFQFAIMRLDGMGGTVTLSDHAKKLFELTGEKVVVVSRGYEMLFEGNPHVDHTINVGMRDWQECSIVMRNQFDALAEIRFGLGKWYNQNSYFSQNFAEFDSFFNQFPKDFNQLEKYGLHHIQLTDKTLGIPYDSIESKVYADEKIEGFDDFILINNGVDVIHRKMRQTKCWDGWNDLISLLSLKIIQVGTSNDPIVEGAINLREKTSIKQLIYLLKKAKMVIATEGGIAHLAFAAGSRNVIVLGGPTQGKLFEYPGHHWINSFVCGNCWSTTSDWYEKCPKDCDSVCMKSITAQRVADTIQTFLE